MTGDGSLATRLAELAERAAAGVRLIAGVSILSALTFWTALFYPFTLDRWWTWLLSLALLAVLSVPAGILVLVHMVLRELVNLPARLRETGAAGRMRAGRAADAVRGRRRWWLPRVGWELWRIVVDNRELLLAYTGLVRLATPAVLGVVAGAVLATGLLLGTAIVAVLVAAF